VTCEDRAARQVPGRRVVAVLVGNAVDDVHAGEPTLEDLLVVVEDFDAARAHGPVEPAAGVAVVQAGERLALLCVALAHDLGQSGGPDAVGDRFEPAAGLDGRELPGVADRDHLRADACCVREEPLALPR
jgi:hypothetical protein